MTTTTTSAPRSGVPGGYTARLLPASPRLLGAPLVGVVVVLVLPACAPRATPGELALLGAVEGSLAAARDEIAAGDLCLCEDEGAVVEHLDEARRSVGAVRRSLATDEAGWLDYLKGAVRSLKGG